MSRRINKSKAKTMLILPDCSEKSDNELVALTLQEKSYFKCLMDRYEAKLKRYILRISSINLEEAEDILQDVFLKVYKNLNGFDQNLKFSSWIYRITHNEVISQHRKAQARPRLTEISEEIIKNIRSEFDLEREIHNTHLAGLISGALDGLKPAHREVLILKFFEEKSYEEISDILKKSTGTVATLIRAAKKEFKEQWPAEKAE
jgi:RNA polymerase sigma-70 factor (ECF subfamily)